MLRTATVLAISLFAASAFADDPAEGLAQRLADKTKSLDAGGGDDATEAAVRAGLLWLARHQSRGGAWHAAEFSDECFADACEGAGLDEYDTGATALALLAFLGNGITPASEEKWRDPVTKRDVEPGKVVEKAASWLEKNQNQDGSFGPKGSSKSMYNHAIATAAMCELYGLTREKNWKLSAIAAVDFLGEAQNPGKAWRYAPKCGDNDASVTSWCVQALHAATVAGLATDQESLKSALRWIDEITDQEWDRVGYTMKGTGKVVIPGKNEDFEGHNTMTAVGMLTRLYSGAKPGSHRLHESAKQLVCDLPTPAPVAKGDVYYWYHGTEALWECNGPGTKYWEPWNTWMKEALLTKQEAGTDCEAGSWDPAKDRWGCEGGRVYTTALGVMTLEVYYRYAGAGRREEGK